MLALRGEAREGGPQVGAAIEVGCGIDLPCQESLSQRAPWNEPDPKFLDCRQHFCFRISLHTEYSLWTAVMGWTAWRDGSSLLQPRKDRHFHRSPIDAGKRDGDQEFGLGLRDIDRRFPAQVMDLWKNGDAIARRDQSTHKPWSTLEFLPPADFQF